MSKSRIFVEEFAGVVRIAGPGVENRRAHSAGKSG
jgi:hypothetical protein